MDSRLENLSVQILQGLLAGRKSILAPFDIEESYVTLAVHLAEMLIVKCEKSTKK